MGRPAEDGAAVDADAEARAWTVTLKTAREVCAVSVDH